MTLSSLLLWFCENRGVKILNKKVISLFKYYLHLHQLFYTHTKAVDMNGDPFIEIGSHLLQEAVQSLTTTNSTNQK